MALVTVMHSVTTKATGSIATVDAARLPLLRVAEVDSRLSAEASLLVAIAGGSYGRRHNENFQAVESSLCGRSVLYRKRILIDYLLMTVYFC